jgi:hypothetical protein
MVCLVVSYNYTITQGHLRGMTPGLAKFRGRFQLTLGTLKYTQNDRQITIVSSGPPRYY